jgi:hypothetical protein
MLPGQAYFSIPDCRVGDPVPFRQVPDGYPLGCPDLKHLLLGQDVPAVLLSAFSTHEPRYGIEP